VIAKEDLRVLSRESPLLLGARACTNSAGTLRCCDCVGDRTRDIDLECRESLFNSAFIASAVCHGSLDMVWYGIAQAWNHTTTASNSHRSVSVREGRGTVFPSKLSAPRHFSFVGKRIVVAAVCIFICGVILSWARTGVRSLSNQTLSASCAVQMIAFQNPTNTFNRRYCEE